MSFMQILVGRKPTAEEQIRKWKQQIRSQEREVDKNARSLLAEETKVTRSLKDAAKRGDTASAKVLAMEVARSRRARDRLSVAKAQLGSLNLTIQHQAAMARTVGALQRSTQAMTSVSQLIKLPLIQASMRDMALEMAKSGFIEESIEDTLESTMPDEEELELDMDDEEDAVVNAILYEATNGALGSKPKQKITPQAAPNVPTTIPTLASEDQTPAAADTENLESRLNALREM